LCSRAGFVELFGLTRVLRQGGEALKTGICPKCKSHEVYSGADIPLKKGPFGSNSIPIGLTSIAALDNYVCVACGFVERYVSEVDKLAEISKKWTKVEDAKAEEAAAPPGANAE